MAAPSVPTPALWLFGKRKSTLASSKPSVIASMIIGMHGT